MMKIIFCLILVSFVFSGCNGYILEPTIPIKKLLDNPREYENKTVKIEGQVSDVFSFFVIKCFAVKDNTSEIIVVTERILPKKGENIKVRGRLLEAFSVGDQTLTVIKEEKD